MSKVSLLCLLLWCIIVGLAWPAVAVPVTGQRGPGGIESTTVNTSTLELWLDAGAITGATNNTPIANWNNRSTYTGAAAVATQSVAAQQPLYIAAVAGANNQPAVRFDGNPAAGLGDQFAVSSLNLGVNASGFVVYLNGPQNSDPGSCCRTLFSESTSGANIGNNGYALYVNRGDVVPKTLQIGKGTGAAAPTLTQDPFNVDSQFHLTSFRSSATSSELRDNGTTLVTGALAGSPTGTNYLIAANAFTSARDYAGDIAEIALFNREVNLAERPIIENYLSAKYNIAISGNLYNGDNAGVDYDRDVFGVGRVNASNQALNSGSAGFGIQVTGGVAANQLNDGEFVLAGHRTAVASIIDASPAPEFGGERWSRVWNVDTNGGSVDATLGFNFADAGLGSFFDPTDSFQLLYSTDSTFASYEILNLGFTIDPSNTITFNVPASLLLNGYYTLGINATFVPEPNSMLLMLGVLGCGLLRRRKQVLLGKDGNQTK